MAFALNQTGIIIVRNMSSTDRRQQNRTMRTITVMGKRAMAIKTVTVTGNRSDENKEKQRP